MPKPRSRYWFSRRGGSWCVFDRLLDIRIAKCDFREAAFRITFALNEQEFRLERTAITEPVTESAIVSKGRVTAARAFGLNEPITRGERTP
jgi:hypothetical protein